MSRARNAGVHASAAECILFCDADDVVSTRWVGALIAALGSYDLVGRRLDCMQLNTPFIRTRLHLASEELPATTYGNLPFAVAGSMGCHGSVFDAVAGFDESFEFGYDDQDFSLRAQYAGVTIGFVPAAVVHYRFRDELLPYARQRTCRTRSGVLSSTQSTIARQVARAIEKETTCALGSPRQAAWAFGEPHKAAASLALRTPRRRVRGRDARVREVWSGRLTGRVLVHHVDPR